MSKFTERLKSLAVSVAHSFREYPVEALLGLTYYVLFILTDLGVKPFGRDVASPYLFFAPLMILTFCLHRFARQTGRRVWTVLYIASWLLWIPVWLFVPERPAATVTVVIYLEAFILLFAGCSRQDNETYIGTILHTLIKGGAALIVGGILAGLLSAIIASVDYLFANGDFPGEIYSYPNMLIALVLTPLLCCLFISEERMELKGTRFLTIIVDYLLSPALLVYSLILYMYILRILFAWELPAGGVAYMVGGFVATALACMLLQELLEVRHFDWYYKYFPYVAIAPLVLLWIGVFRRIGEYGLTEARFYLIWFAVLLTVFTVMLLFQKTRRFPLMAVIVGLVAALLTFIPGVRAKDFGIRSQLARLEKVLPALLVDGRIPDAVPYRQIAASPELEASWEKADGAWTYLRKAMSREEFNKLSDRYGNLSYSSWELSQAKDRLEKPDPDGDGEMEVHSLRGHIDLGEYSRFLDDGEYWCYEDAAAVVFYADAERTKELLRCEITERLDACKQDETATDAQRDSAILVYRNDRYLAIFNSITDYRSIEGSNISFTTSRKMLFEKP